ncbi:DEAD/DEAH box helicase family protein [Gelidibacter maritimus]|uniref:DEAD/DEAH box helicase family protein n=1 Tax=Gelidibacter maritimus TaxID=2761487 RepID=A0A7W2M3J5_9FLAO|nr:DEAD/DEAH box helicase family protein [Gelidibacter maritimus]MBA6151836.1 DEAD/DEAH box helicase family protein [Gelidibacter maritimus]
MNNRFRDLQFVFTWRNYQQILLENFERHLSDRHFHVVAPPGSGKTILGIEIIRKIGKKTLVLAPTLTIRNQWEKRLQEFFTKYQDFKNFSFNIKEPSDITFVTYQSLHAWHKSFESLEDFTMFFEKHQIEVLVLDEAHHLKNSWWQTLMDLKNTINPYVVALTATPPYDSDRTEISKYFTLCGPIDDEIAVPDLVKATDLSPHQDFVYLSKPDDLEINFIVAYRQRIADFVDALLVDETFKALLVQHRFYCHTSENLEDLYDNVAYFSSILIFLNKCGVRIPNETLKILGFAKNETITFPDLTLEWVQSLLQNILVNDRLTFEYQESYLKSLENELKRINGFKNGKIDFIGDTLLYKSLTKSPSKLKSIAAVVRSEYEQLNGDLRCVILTDYIRKEFCSIPNDQIPTIDKIGVIPIFQYLRYHFADNQHLAVLSGSIVVVHQSLKATVEHITGAETFLFSEFPSDVEFLMLSPKSGTLKSTVEILTMLFEQGDIKILVGTKSLLGEGWDAPSINSLILASFVGAFVSSNQMRGRAIRKNPLNPHKVGNIWHLACIDPTASNGGKDIETLQRRFQAFMGVSNDTFPVIENGMDRLKIPKEIGTEDVEALNKITLQNSKNRKNTTNSWQVAINSGSHLTREVKLMDLDEIPYKQQKSIYYKDMVLYFILELLLGLGLFFIEYFVKSIQVILSRGIYYFLNSLIIALMLSFGYRFYKAFQLYSQHGFLFLRIEKMGHAILDTLYELGHMTTKRDHISLISEFSVQGQLICCLNNASRLEDALFARALSQLLAPIETPRYLIIRTSFFKRRLAIENFYAVPEIFGNHKKRALTFQKHWNHHLGKSKLIYTRHLEGRKLLLKARLLHISNKFREVSREVMVWK